MIKFGEDNATLQRAWWEVYFTSIQTKYVQIGGASANTRAAPARLAHAARAILCSCDHGDSELVASCLDELFF